MPRPSSVPGLGLGDLAALAGPAAAGARLRDGGAEVVVTGVSLDSRTVRPGDLYAALPGFTTHGARFAGGARANGAVAVLTDEEGARIIADGEAGGIPLLVVEDPRGVLGEVSSAIYGNPSHRLRMVGITGTNGKTTTAYLLESALRALGQATGLIGTVETRIGATVVESARTTPEATDLHAILACMLEAGIDTCVMEVSSHALALHRVDGVHYDVALFTNLSQDHLDFHSDMEDYFRAKAQLFTPERSRQAVICTDDAWGQRLLAECPLPAVSVGRGEDAQHRVEEIEPGRFRLVEREGSHELLSHLPGTFNEVNTSMAYAALRCLGIDADAAARAVSEHPQVPGRMEPIRLDGPAADRLPRVVVDFAHTADAIEAALVALRPSTPGLLVAVTGAGGDRDREKRGPMGRAAAAGADVLVITDDNPRSEDPASIREAVAAGASALPEGERAQVHVEARGRAEAIRRAITLAADHDNPQDATVVILGKGHERGQEVAGVVHPFDDRATARAVLEALATAGAAPSSEEQHHQ